jgi:uncharacterized RDD family membrane protein YckC
MAPSDPLNPYAPPSATIEPAAPTADDQGAALADRGARLGAALLDWLLSAAPVGVAGLTGFVVSLSNGLGRSMLDEGGRVPYEDLLQQMVPFMIGLAIGALGALGVGLYQCHLITRTGQSIAKRWLKIKIVNLDGSPVTFGSGVGLRGVVPFLLGCVPYLGLVFMLLDALFIFRDDRRCLHDLMAGTKVISAARE